MNNKNTLDDDVPSHPYYDKVFRNNHTHHDYRVVACSYYAPGTAYLSGWWFVMRNLDTGRECMASEHQLAAGKEWAEKG